MITKKGVMKNFRSLTRCLFRWLVSDRREILAHRNLISQSRKRNVSLLFPSCLIRNQSPEIELKRRQEHLTRKIFNEGQLIFRRCRLFPGDILSTNYTYTMFRTMQIHPQQKVGFRVINYLILYRKRNNRHYSEAGFIHPYLKTHTLKDYDGWSAFTDMSNKPCLNVNGY